MTQPENAGSGGYPASKGTAASDFLALPTLEAAPGLLGKILVRRHGGSLLKGRIVEVEAYHQVSDPASHSHRGPTARNAVMFGPPGHCYVYFIYGVHYCMNLVTEPEGVGAAVLIRAIEPLAGIETMRKLRTTGLPERQLANGPGKLCQAFAIGPQQNGCFLMGDGELFISEGLPRPDESIQCGPRIGITKAAELPWRFYLTNNPFVSAMGKRFRS